MKQQQEETTNGQGTSLSTVEKKQITASGRGLELKTFDDFWRMAGVAHASGQYSAFKTREQVFMAIQAGAEIGLSPNQSLQSIAVINGKTSLYGDGLLAVVRGSGLCGGIEEWIEGTGEESVAHCRAKRRDTGETIERTFSYWDAKKAGLAGKSGPWQGYGPRMLAMRARAFCLRDGFADVLRGISCREEVESYDAKPQTKVIDLADE